MKKWQGLKKELKSAKKNRNVKIKEIIFECGCSKPHFDKVISGERKPGKDLIKKLSKSLGISESEINKLISSPIKDNRKFYIAIIIACFIFLIIVHNFNKSIFNINSVSITPTKKEPRILGDNTSFIKDVTIPDGSYVFINSNFKKIWRIKNSGIIPWKNRYLMRITPFSDTNCKSDSMVSIKDTPIGSTVDIEVNFTSMELVGSCRTDWKMVDKNKNIFFPNKHTLYSEVHVTNDKKFYKQ